MGACCSSLPSADAVAQPVHVEAVGPPISSARDHEDPVSELVHVLATVRTSQQRPASGGAQHSHHHHHQHRSRGAGYTYSSHAPKQLLRATSPPVQPQQHELYGLSPRSFQQLQQLLPNAPLQQAASGPHHQHQHQRTDAYQDNGVSLLSSHHSSSVGNALVHARASFSLQEHHSNRLDSEQAPGSPLQQLHSVSSGNSDTTTRAVLLSTRSASANLSHPPRSSAPGDCLSPSQVLAVCGAVVQEEATFQAAGITPLLLAAVCLIESGGCPQAKQYREHLGDTAHGLCQMLLSTAQWLATSQGFDRHGITPGIKDLEDPKTCVYFTAGYLSVLSHYEGSSKSEGFVVKAYHAGPKGVDTAAACNYLQKYIKAKHWLTEVAKAMAVTVAAAALAVHVGLPESGSATAGAFGAAAPGPGLCVDADVKVALPVALGSKNQYSKDQGSGSDAADIKVADTYGCSNSDAVSTNSKQVTVRRATAHLVATLSSTWTEAGAAAGIAGRAGLGGLGASSIFAHMLPGRWGLSSSRSQGLAARFGGPDGNTLPPESALELVAIEAASLAAAWQRLLCIAPAVTAAALNQARAAAAMAPHPSDDWPPREGSAGGAAALNTRGSMQRSNSRCRSAVQKTPDQLPAVQALDSMPCVIHVVGPGESLQQIASACNVGVSDLLAANPEVSGQHAIHQNDCIALPVPAVFPRLYVSQLGDTLHGIARAHEVPMGRVLAKNPELAHNLDLLQPGWVVALPGLKGSSQMALPQDWLTQASLSSELAQAPEGDIEAGDTAGRPVELCWPLQQQGADAPRQEEQLVVGTDTALPAASVQHRPRSRHTRHRRQHNRAQGQSCSTLAGAAVRVGQSQQQQHHSLPCVGSGAFLFTVQAPASTSGSSRLQAGASSGQQPMRATAKPHKGRSDSSAAITRHGLEAAQNWTVGTAAGHTQ